MLFIQSILAVVLLCISFVLSAPMPLPLQPRNLGAPVQIMSLQRDVAEIAQAKRASANEEKRQNTGTNNLGDSDPTESNGGAIVPYTNGKGKRQNTGTNNLGDSDPTESNGGAIVPYTNGKGRRHAQEVNTFPTYLASRSDGGEVVPF